MLVDVGTGFYVEKSPEDGIKFYKGKVDDLTKNLSEIEKAVGGKNENLRIIEEGMFYLFSWPPCLLFKSCMQ